ncbi:hypothetical protein EDD55_1035 [Varunaivibrio sulfuroxidans]|uniref:Uncharacterized protein n=1 Tax=Varunaivibrio sulfuroxidans TaxID=1773489 RepID=A0A4R3JDA8_9PROT|nr:hypothetical protein EDD55_1035 [Varunaivibrio sulfuroxidans]
MSALRRKISGHEFPLAIKPPRRRVAKLKIPPWADPMSRRNIVLIHYSNERKPSRSPSFFQSRFLDKLWRKSARYGAKQAHVSS